MDEEAKLLVVSHGKDEDGYSVENKIEYPVYVSEKSVSRTEFYKALSEHINLKMILELEAGRLEPDGTHCEWEKGICNQN